VISTSEILNDIKLNGIARKNRFLVEIQIPDKVVEAAAAKGVKVDSRTLSLRCYSTQLPPKSIASTDVKIGGVNQKIPYSRTFDDVTMTFLIERNMNTKKVFDIWQDVIAPNDFGHVAYADDISTTVSVSHITNTDTIEYTLFLKKAYPIIVNSLDYANDDNESYQALGVTWTFRTVSSTMDSKETKLTTLPSFDVFNKDGFTVASVMEFTNQLASFNLQGEALLWYQKADNFVGGFTGGYGINSIGSLVKRMEFSVTNNIRFLESDRAKITTAISSLKSKLGIN